MAVSVVQRHSEFQSELIQLREIFDENLRRYEGNDPLEIWYDYVLKVEDVYTKYGGNTNSLKPILEKCLNTFETNTRYKNDRRICKLWIKYIDLHSNPVELYQILYSKGICQQCADLYCAWALYHEISGNFKQADNVFEMGMWAFAQPYEELVIAHKNMVFMAGLQMIHGVDERRINERKQVLAALHRNRFHQQTIFYNTRQSSAEEHHPSLPFLANTSIRPAPNDQLQPNPPGAQGGILDAIKSRDSVLTTASTSDSRSIGANVPQFGNDGIRLYLDFYSTNHDDFSDWHVELFYADQQTQNVQSMYPKHLVYTNNTEYSLEEIRSRRYLAKKNTKNNNDEQMSEEIFSQDSGQPTETHVEPKTNKVLTTPPYGFTQQGESFYSQNPTGQHFLQTSTQNYQIQPNHESQMSQTFEAGQPSTNFEGSQPTPNFQGSQPNQNFGGGHPGQNFIAGQENRNFGSQTTQGNQNFVAGQNFGGSQTSRNFVGSQTSQNLVESQSINPSVQNFNQSGQNFNQSGQNFNQSGQNFNQSGQNFNQPGQNFNQQGQNFSQSSQNFNQPFNVQPNQNFHESQSVHQNFHHPQPQSSPIYSQMSPIQNKKPEFVQSPQNFKKPVKDQDKTDLMKDAVPNAAAIWQNSSISEENPSFTKELNDFWKDSTTHDQRFEVKKPTIQTFKIHEDTKFLIDDTTRSPDRRPFSSQPLPQNQQENLHQNFTQPNNYVLGRVSTINRTPNVRPPPFTDHMREDIKPEFPQIKKAADIFEDTPTQNFSDMTCANTQMFFNNINTRSTPFNLKKMVAQQYANEIRTEEHENLKTNRQRLFNEHDEEIVQQNQSQQDKLSVIYEISKEICSSSGSSVGSTPATLLKIPSAYSLKAIPENITMEKSQIENSKNYQYVENKDTRHSIYMENSIRNTTRDVPEQSYRMNLKDEHILGLHNRTPSPRSTVTYNMTLQNHSISNTQTTHYSLAPDKSLNSSKMPGYPTDPSYIYIKDDDDSPNGNTSNLMRLSEIAVQQSQMQNFEKKTQESPSKEMFYDGSNDSNSVKDIWGRSPAKGSKMDIDVMSQHSNSELKMDFDSCPEPPIKDDILLLKTPSDPFSSKLIKALLLKVGFPNQRHKQNYVVVQNTPRLVKKETACFGDDRYLIINMIGKGNYGSVFKATRINTKEQVALKVQKPANQWEFYICSEIQHRIVNPHLLKAFMTIQVGFFSPTTSILVSEFCKHGSLLDISNKVKQVMGKGIKELVVIYFANEIMTIVNALHQCQIIHADIKPDNFLVTRMPPEFGHPCLQLIDFGCSIDMSLFPKDTRFTKVINTENFICTEMKDGRPWTYQTDLFCIAATVHVLLFEKYMQVQKCGSVWNITTRIPRYLRTDLWNTFFFQFLNIESCNTLPDVNAIKHSFESIISECSEELQLELRYVANSVIGR